MGDQIRFIKSTAQGSELGSIFTEMYKDKALTDCTLCVGQQKIDAHRIVLAASSSYFRNLFERPAHPYNYPTITMDQAYFEDLKLVLEFMYKGEVLVPQDRYQQVLRLASSLEVEGFPGNNVQSN